jgi:hypothetical protein
MGELLSVPVLIAGAVIVAWARRNPAPIAAQR